MHEKQTMRPIRATGWAVLLLGTLLPAPAPAQLGRVALGGGVGVAGGAVVTLSTIVARARFQQEFLESADDLIHWQSLPMIAGPAAGVVFGLAGEEALRGSIVGSVGGMAIGAAVGAGMGWIFSPYPEGPWAGGVIGAGVGMAAGGLTWGLRAWSQDENAELDLPEIALIGITVPVR